MNRGIFITGTDTEVGKTYVAALLVKALRQRGVNVGYYKPALSGALRCGGVLVPGDAAYVAKTAGLAEDPTDLVSYMFEEAVSPHLAAARQGVEIQEERLLADFAAHQKNHEFLVVEGAGGITCPLRLKDKPLLLSHIIKALDLPTIIVAEAGLGAINHTLLTAAYAKAEGLPLKGFVLNRYEAGNFLHEDNRRQIQRLTDLPILGCIPTKESGVYC